MNNSFNKTIDSAKGLSLTEEEKREIVSRISSHVEKNPLGDTRISTVRSPYYFRFTFLRVSWVKKQRNKLVPVVLALLVIILGGGTALGANFSLPGDILYPIKININEKLQSFFAVGSNAKIRVQTDLANQRLDEAEKLAFDGKINFVTQEKIKKNFGEHADKLDKLISEIESQGDPEGAVRAGSRFEDQLKNHHDNLNQLSRDNEGNREEIDEINETVNTHLNSLIQSNNDKRKNNAEKNSENIENQKNQGGRGNSSD